ncbi:diiron oxygenase [Micromonospora sp. NPDC050276]|uniref:diiron oxygenase n=1 Tax=Micromonospora sp. NPDC050276 TaxID=3364278 RepID=UPI0037975E94
MEVAPAETERAAVAERLLTSSLRTSYDPTVEIDWDAPHAPGGYWLPPHRSSLYGTSLWEQLSQEQRVELTKHEVASAASAAYTIANRLVHPDVYAAVGIPPAVGRATARANPHWRATLRWSAARVHANLADVGLVAGPGRLLWARAGLI